MKTITLTINPEPYRLSYLQSTVASLNANNTAGYRLLINMEPAGNFSAQSAQRSMVEIIESIEMPYELKINDEKLGLDKNLFNCIFWAFEGGSEFNVHIEDDVTLSPNALDLANWYYETFKDKSEDYFSYGLHSFDGKGANECEIIPIEYFMGWGWCVFKCNWEIDFGPYWFDYDLAAEVLGDTIKMGDIDIKMRHSWDGCILAHCKKNNLKQLVPSISRSRHDGMFGKHTDPSLFPADFVGKNISRKSLNELPSNYFLSE
jgi:hypothetical protein